MVGITKRFINAARIAMGKDPLFLTTSPQSETVIHSSIFIKKPWLANELTHLEAESTGYKDPKNQFWKVATKTDDGLQVGDPQLMSYDRVRILLMLKEWEAAKAAGVKGTEAEIKARRLSAVEKTNILRFV